MKTEKEVLLLTIKERKLAYLGHVMRGKHNQLHQVITQGNIEEFWRMHE